MAWRIENTGEFVNHGKAASLNDMPICTSIVIIKILSGAVASGHPQRWVCKSGAFLQLTTVDNAGINVLQSSVNRATQSQLTNAQWSDFVPPVTTGQWYFIVSQTNVSASAASSDQRIFVGSLGRRPAEPTAYVTQRTGSGAQVTNATQDLYIGSNPVATTQAAEADIAEVGLWNRLLSKREIAEQWQNWRTGRRLANTPGCVLRVAYDKRSSKAVDESGRRNHGSVTGSPVLVASQRVVTDRARRLSIGLSIAAPTVSARPFALLGVG